MIQTKFRLLLSTSDGSVIAIQEFKVTASLANANGFKVERFDLVDFDLSTMHLKEEVIRYQRRLLSADTNQDNLE